MTRFGLAAAFLLGCSGSSPTTEAAEVARAVAQLRDPAAAIAGTRETRAGICGGASAATGPRGEAHAPPPPPDVAEAIRTVCDGGASVLLRHPHDVLAVAREGDAWGAVRTPVELGRDAAWPVALFAVAVIAVGAEALRRMASRLAAARAKARTYEAQLRHEQRLSALGRVVAGVAHEVRNPLAGIKLRLDVALRSDEATPQIREDLGVALAEVGRLDRLVAALLASARRGTMGPVSLAALVDERIAIAAPLAGARSVEVHRDGDGELVSDRDALSQALDNLIRNAIEASPPGSPVEVAIQPHADRVELAVSDRGAGASGVELFEPFATTKPEGVGLGTFIARSLITAIGGTITYEREDPWTRLRISLPTS